MQILDSVSDILSYICKGSGKWGIYVSGLNTSYKSYESDVKEILKAAPWINDIDKADQYNLLYDGQVYLLFDTQAEMDNIYQQTVGDDGPTEKNPYNGPWRVYCLTCNPDGQLLTENT